ncbi:MAG: protein-disulfide reductase DsbD family protein [Holosporales bacterium]
MRLLSFLFFLGCTLMSAHAPSAHAQSNNSPMVQATLLSSRQAAAPGESFSMALRQDITPGWHTYWRNPGDSGEQTRLVWQLPEDWNVSAIAWPAPQAIAMPPLVNYGFSGTVILPVTVSVPDNAIPGTVIPIKVRAVWLVCKDVCIPESADLVYSLTIDENSIEDVSGAGLIAETKAKLPRTFNAPLSLSLNNQDLFLDVSALQSSNSKTVYFFPYDNALIDHAAPQLLNDTTLNLKASGAIRGLLANPPGQVEGLLRITTTSGETTDKLIQASFTIAAAPTTTEVSPHQPVVTPSGLTLSMALVFALLGGLILNLMPCVFPVLSLKALSFASAHDKDLPAIRREAVAFVMGVQVSLMALAGLLLGLKASGMAVGWGFQLQFIPFVAAMTVLFYLIALNLLGIIYISGSKLQNIGQALTHRTGVRGAFFTGALAVLVATPCTAPFMGAAMGMAFAQPGITTILIFMALGFGLALPFALLALRPSWARCLPRPGKWMETFRQALAFPMLAAMAWLFWVATRQGGATVALWLLTLLIIIAFLAWLRRHGVRTIFLVLVGTVVTLGVLSVLGRHHVAKSITPHIDTWSPEAVQKARQQGHPVFVNFTADWCVTCLVNERTTLSSSSVQEAFTKRGVVVLTADWTNQDEAIADELARFGRIGVPLYLLYPPGVIGEPQVLPQLLTPTTVLDALTATRKPLP